MSEWIVNHEVVVRLVSFGGVFAIIAIWELLAPKRVLLVSKARRWVANIGIIIINTVVLRILFPAAAVGVAAFSAQQGWGLLHYYSVPALFDVLIAVIILDFVIYLQHVMFHAVPVLWRLHRMHHADLDFDVTTGARFHPIEIILSMLFKFVVIVVLGPPLLAVIIFEVLLNGTTMFNHGNIKLPLGVDKALRWVLVTPDMHRVHHSILEHETNSNFGFNLSWWDRMFGTYRDQPEAGHTDMTIGISSFRDVGRCAGLIGMLTIPFVGKVTEYAINRRPHP